MTPFRLALIGGGVIARAHVAAAEASDGRAQIVAVVDPLESARRALSDVTGAATFGSFDELLNSHTVKIDGVIVCTPPSVRIPMIRAALESGIAVLCEKPLAHKVADAKALVDLARKHANVRSAVAFCHRFVPAILEIKRRVEAQELGTLLRFENTFAGWNPAMKDKWMSDLAASGGGSFIDTGCHSLDLFRFLVGEPKVVGAVFHREWPDRGESSATVMLRSGSVAGVIQSGWLEPGRFVITVVGTKGLMSYDYERPTELIHRPSQGAPEIVTVASHEVRFCRQLLDFAEVKSDTSRQPGIGALAGFDDGLRVSQLIDDAARASII